MMLINRVRTACFFAVALSCVAWLAPRAEAQNLWKGTNSNLWNDPGNWSLGVVPASNTASQRAVFTDVGALNATTVTYDVLGTVNAHSVTFNADAGAGMTIDGFDTTKRPSFTGSGLTAHTIPGIRYDVLAGNHILQGLMGGGSSYDIGFSPSSATEAAPKEHGFYVEAGASLTFNATLGRSVAGYNRLVKYGDGLMVMNSTTSMGQTSYAVNGGILRMGVAGSRGNSSNSVTVNAGGTWQINNVTYAGNNGLLTLNGTGFNGMGALHATGGVDSIVPSTTSGSAVVVGKLSIATDSSIGVDSGSVLTLAHGIDGATSPGNVTKVGTGTLVFRSNNELPQYGYTGSFTVAQGTMLVNSQALASMVTGSIAGGAANRSITLTSSAGLTVGQTVSGTGVGAGAFITAIATDGVSVTISQELATATTGETYTFAGISSALNTSPVTVQNGATLGGTGSISGSAVTVNSGGILAPGASVGTFTVGSADIDGTLALEYDGSTIDKLAVAGALDVTGATLAFTNLNALTGSAHVIAQYGSLVGNPFTTVTGLPSGYTLNYNYQNNNQIALVATLHPGDFDGDGDVDGADFVAWQTNFPKPSGATLAQGDADGDGDVDGADFVVWQTNFPFSPGPSAAPVPEPAAWTLALLALGGAKIRARRRY
jgi:autotransporter-associated beta strand protein